MSLYRILSVKGNLVAVDQIEAFDATPVLDLKPFNPSDATTEEVRVPSWAGGNGRR